MALTIGGATVAAMALQASGQAAAIAAQVTAPPPFGVFHDLRWVLGFHPSWQWFAVEIVAAVALRGTFIGVAVRLAWPRDRERPSLQRSILHGITFAAVASLVMAPWAVLLFGMSVTPVSWLFIAAMTPALLLAIVIHRGAVSGGRWQLPRPRTAGWTVLTFLVLSAGGGLAGIVPVVAIPAAALTGLFNAWAWFGVVHAVACGATPRSRLTRFPLAPVAAIVLIATFFGVAAFAFDAVLGNGRVVPEGSRPDTGGDVPVLVAGGFGSSWDGQQTNLLPRPYHEVQFSYRGLDASGSPLPYDARATHQSLDVLATKMDRQIAVLARRAGRPVDIIAQSEGTMVTLLALVGDHPEVGRVLLLSPLIVPGRVYYPPTARNGWGVVSGWMLRGMTWLVGHISPYETRPDQAFIRSIVERAPQLRALSVCPPAGTPIAMLLPVADGLAAPPDAHVGVPAKVVAAFHAHFLHAGSSSPLIVDYLAGGTLHTPLRWRLLYDVVRGFGASWQVPAVPTSLPAAWREAPVPAPHVCGAPSG